MAALTLLTLSFFVIAQDIPLDDASLTPARREALKKWKPGPKLQAELDALDRAGLEALALHREGNLDERSLLRERARRQIASYVLRAWSFSKGRDEVATIAVIIPGTSEINQVFPRGLGHLPKQLHPKSIYESTPGSHRRWQYVGERKQGGYRFAIFRAVE